MGSVDNWLHVLEKEYRKRGMEKPFGGPENNLVESLPEGEDLPPELTLNDFSLQTKVKILFDLCEFLLENIQSFHDHILKGYDAGVYWRLEPLGLDAKGLKYWVFDDGRLFREHVEAKTGLPTDNSTWELVSSTLHGWQEFQEQLSNKPGDRKLKAAIEGRWIEIEAALHEQDKFAKKKAKELYSAKIAYDLIPRKRSSRIQAKEAMQKLKEQEEEDERASRLNAMAESNKSKGLPPPVHVPGGLTREERAEQRRLRIEREANEKVLKELEAERASKEEKNEVDVVSQDVHTASPLKITIRRSSIPNVQETAEPLKSKKAAPKPKTVVPPIDPQKQKMLELMEMAIQRELAQRQQRPLAPQQTYPLPGTQSLPQFAQQRPPVPQQLYGLPQPQYTQMPRMGQNTPIQQPQLYPQMQFQRPPSLPHGHPGYMNQHSVMSFQQPPQQMYFQQYLPRPMHNPSERQNVLMPAMAALPPQISSAAVLASPVQTPQAQQQQGPPSKNSSKNPFNIEKQP
jgi:hypothetical protein